MKKAILCVFSILLTFLVPYGWSGTESVLYSFKGFTGGNDGALPVDSARLLRATSGVLYGTTAAGGTCGRGTIFSVTPTGAQSVLYNFCGTDGANPYGSLVMDNSGTLYGTTYSGGDNDCGIVFKLSGPVFTRLYSFSCAQDGSNPAAGVIRDGKGNLYGTTFHGGNLSCPQNLYTGCGVVYKISASGTFNAIYIFCSSAECSDGAAPLCDLAFGPGGIYGTTAGGGANNLGTVFELLKAKTPTGWKENVLHSFAGTDGDGPHAGLKIVTQLVNGQKTTFIFGVAAGSSGYQGNAFELMSSGGGYSFSVIHNFTGTNGDGAQPLGPLMWVNGKLFGTTSAGGDTNCSNPSGCGIVFELTNNNNVWTETVLHVFEGSDGNGPQGGLVGSAKHLYGVTYVGGDLSCYGVGCGVVFSVKP